MTLFKHFATLVLLVLHMTTSCGKVLQKKPAQPSEKKIFHLFLYISTEKQDNCHPQSQASPCLKFKLFNPKNRTVMVPARPLPQKMFTHCVNESVLKLETDNYIFHCTCKTNRELPGTTFKEQLKNAQDQQCQAQHQATLDFLKQREKALDLQCLTETN